MGRNIITSLWGNCTIKVMVGFLFLYPAFVAKSHDASGWEQLRILGLIGAAAAHRQLRRQLHRRPAASSAIPRSWWCGRTIAVTAVALADRADRQPAAWPRSPP